MVRWMRLRFQTTIALLLILAAMPCSGCVRQSECPFAVPFSTIGPTIPEGFGVNIHFTNPQRGEIKMLYEAGFRWVRMDFVWAATEREAGSYDFSDYDRLMAALESYKIRALFILDYGNPLYDGAPPRSEATRQAFARWAVAAAKHFAGRGVIWEVYNEPNHSTFWPPKANVQEYVALALAVGRAFREAVPGEKLIGPATSEVDFSFLEACFKAGLLEYWSAVSVHPYRGSDPETAATDYCQLRRMIKTYAPVITGSAPGSPAGQPGGSGSSDGATSKKEIPIFSGEWGYSSGWPNMNDERQGQLLARTWLTNLANDVSLSIWYDWHDDGATGEAEHHFGTVYNSYHEGRDPVFDPKPSYLAARTLATFFSGYRFEKRLEAGGADDYVLVFRKGDNLRFAAWTSATRSHQITIPLSPGQYLSNRHTGETIAGITADQKGATITLTNAPVYLR